MNGADQTRGSSSDDGEHALDVLERDALQLRLDRAELALLDQRDHAREQILHHKLAVEYVADERIKTTLGEVSALHRAEVEDTVSLVRAILAGECPVETYYRLKQIRPELLTTREWLTVTLWETVQPLKEEVQRLRTHNNMLKTDLKQGNLRAEKHTQDLLFIQKSVEQHAEMYQRQIQELTREKLKMKTQLEKLSVELEHQQKKMSANPVVLEAENRDLKNLVEVLQHKITLLEAVDSENPNTVKTVGDLQQHKKLLQSELMYMTSKDAAHEAILHTAESKIKDLEKRVQDLTDCNEKYLAELLKKREESDAEMYQKGRSALNSQNLHHQEDLVKLRDNMEKEHRTRENILKDSRDDAELRLKRAEAELKQVSNDYTCLKLESGRNILILEDSLREARTRIKIKDQELAKLESCLHEVESNAKLQRNL